MPHHLDAALINRRVAHRLKNPELSDHALREVATLLSFAQYRIELAIVDLDVELHVLRFDTSRFDRILGHMR